MTRPPFLRTVYLVVNDFGQLGRAFVETDIAEADRETIVRNFITGQYSDAIRVVAFNTAEGWSRDVSEDIALEIIQRAVDADSLKKSSYGTSQLPGYAHSKLAGQHCKSKGFFSSGRRGCTTFKSGRHGS
jgi:hypothetical protein